MAATASSRPSKGSGAGWVVTSVCNGSASSWAALTASGSTETASRMSRSSTSARAVDTSSRKVAEGVVSALRQALGEALGTAELEAEGVRAAVHDAAAGRVNQDRAFPHPCDGVRADQAARLGVTTAQIAAVSGV